jgi:hypothetical protein
MKNELFINKERICKAEILKPMIDQYDKSHGWRVLLKMTNSETIVIEKDSYKNCFLLLELLELIKIN